MAKLKFCIVDVNNLVHRSKHVVRHYNSFDDCVGLTLTIVFNSLKKSYEKFGAGHCVACFDSYSWRKEVYSEYKAARADKDFSPKKQEESEIIKRVLVDLKKFLEEYTNVTVLEAPSIEADDFIARWVQLHDDPIFEHTIISADGDFKQLVRKGVELYNPIHNVLYTVDGVFYQDGRKPRKNQRTVRRHGEDWKIKLDKKNGKPEKFDPEWELFYKCIRGDSSDSIKPAYPRVRETRMRKAFEDRGGLEWNNFINSTWGSGTKKQNVRERYELNKTLIDLTAQPEEVKHKIDKAISEAMDKEKKQLVGAYFGKFCSKYRLNKLMSQSSSITQILSAPY